MTIAQGDQTILLLEKATALLELQAQRLENLEDKVSECLAGLDTLINTGSEQSEAIVTIQEKLRDLEFEGSGYSLVDG